MAENGNKEEYATSQNTTSEFQSTRDVVSEGEFNNGGLGSVWGSYENYKEGKLSGSIGEETSFNVNVENVESGCAQLGNTAGDFETNEKSATDTYKAALDKFFGLVGGGSTEEPPTKQYTNLCADVYLLKQDLTSIKDNLIEYANTKDETLFSKDAELLGRFGLDSDFNSYINKAMEDATSVPLWKKVLANGGMVLASLGDGFLKTFENVADGAVLFFGYGLFKKQWAVDFAQKDLTGSLISPLYDLSEQYTSWNRNDVGAKILRGVGTVAAYGLLAKTSVAIGGRLASGTGKVVTKIAPKLTSKIATKMPAVVTKIAPTVGKVGARGLTNYFAGSGSGTETALQNGASTADAYKVGVTQGKEQAITEMAIDGGLQVAGLTKAGKAVKTFVENTENNIAGKTVTLFKHSVPAGSIAVKAVNTLGRGAPSAYAELLTNNKMAAAAQNAANVPSSNEPSTAPGTSAVPDNTGDPGTQWGNVGDGVGYTPTPTPTTEAPTTAPVTETPTVAPTEPPQDNPGTVIGSTGNGGNDFSGEGMSFDADIDDTEILDDVDIGDDLDPSDSIITIPTTIRGTTTKSTKKNSAAGPVLGALGVAAAAGIGAKVYMDNKANNTNGDEDEEYDDFENSEINADEWNDDGMGTTTDNDDSYLMYDKSSLDNLEQGTGEI